MSFVPRTSKKPTLSARETKSKYFQVQTASNSTTTSTTLSDREAPPAIALSAATERKSNSHAQKSGNSTELHTSVKKGGEATSAESLVWTPATVNPSPIPDILARSLDVIFCGINPGMKSAEKGCSYAGPGNHFWPLLHESGFTDRRLHFSDNFKCLDYSVGMCCVVNRATPSSSDLSLKELERGAVVMAQKLAYYSPKVVALNGKCVFDALVRAAIFRHSDNAIAAATAAAEANAAAEATEVESVEMSSSSTVVSTIVSRSLPFADSHSIAVSSSSSSSSLDLLRKDAQQLSIATSSPTTPSATISVKRTRQAFESSNSIAMPVSTSSSPPPSSSSSTSSSSSWLSSNAPACLASGQMSGVEEGIPAPKTQRLTGSTRSRTQHVDALTVARETKETEVAISGASPSSSAGAGTARSGRRVSATRTATVHSNANEAAPTRVNPSSNSQSSGNIGDSRAVLQAAVKNFKFGLQPSDVTALLLPQSSLFQLHQQHQRQQQQQQQQQQNRQQHQSSEHQLQDWKPPLLFVVPSSSGRVSAYNKADKLAYWKQLRELVANAKSSD